MIFLGTGAAELYPNPFCDCATCTRARRENERPRRRSALLYDEYTVIDFGPDVLAASQQYGAPLYNLRNIFITHTHEDHLCLANIEVLTMTPGKRTPVTVWLSPGGYRWLNEFIGAANRFYPGGTGMKKLMADGRIVLREARPYEWFEADGMEIYAVESNHRGNGEDEYALNYVIKSGGILFYVTDSGLYSQSNLDALRGTGADTLIMEGTGGSRLAGRNDGHLNAEHFIENVNAFASNDIIKNDTDIFVTHINQVNSFSHSEYQAYMTENCAYKVTVAYDGMKYDRKP
jgi:phosphoribosyl 1,2-cyclic phosphodiesterase